MWQWRWQNLVMTILSAGSVVAEMTNRVDLVDLARSGEGVTAEGWELHALTNYVSNREAMKFAARDSYLLSPVYSNRLLGVRLATISSSAANRRLQLEPCDALGAALALPQALEYSPTKSTFVEQEVRWPPELNACRFRLGYDEGSSTVWGALYAEVILEGEYVPVPPPPPLWVDGAICLSRFRDGESVVFELPLAAADSIDRKTQVDGLVTNLMCHVFKGQEPESQVSSNAGTTQYQGHYVWRTNEVVSGFGTYTAAKTDRSFGWLFWNDTGQTLNLAHLTVQYGQWGARNQLEDLLAYEWASGFTPPDMGGADGWTASPVDSFVSPVTLELGPSEFPVLITREIEEYPHLLPDGMYFAVRFVDSCPQTGNNAHLGIAALKLEARVVREGKGGVWWIR